ncbi:MAG: hypothetical protein QNK11_08390 [Legionella sp.]|nr:hypothetical protein [Legionella sp.]
MNKKSKLSQLMVGIASLTLSAGVLAGSSVNRVSDPFSDVADGATEFFNAGWDTSMDTSMDLAEGGMGGWKTDHMYAPDYKVVDSVDHRVEYLDGVDKGYRVSNDGALKKLDCRKGDTITDLHSQRSGVITGVKRHGTMDVTTSNGNNVRYQYVVYKVKPVK